MANSLLIAAVVLMSGVILWGLVNILINGSITFRGYHGKPEWHIQRKDAPRFYWFFIFFLAFIMLLLVAMVTYVIAVDIPVVWGT